MILPKPLAHTYLVFFHKHSGCNPLVSMIVRCYLAANYINIPTGMCHFVTRWHDVVAPCIGTYLRMCITATRSGLLLHGSLLKGCHLLFACGSLPSMCRYNSTGHGDPYGKTIVNYGASDILAYTPAYLNLLKGRFGRSILFNSKWL